MSMFSSPSKNQINVGLTILRVAIGAIFVMHGGQKLFVFGLDGVAGAFGQMGVPMAGILGPFVAFVEFLGGLALIFGFLNRLAAFGLAVDMAVAILLVHLKNGFFAPTGFEFPLALMVSSVALAITGAGDWSIDSLIRGKVQPAEVSTERTSLRKAA